MQRVALINGKNKNQDYDLSKIFSSIANPGIIEGLEVQNGKVTPGYAFIEVERNGVIFNVLFQNTGDLVINTTGTKEVFIEINQSNIDDGLSNASDGTGIGEIKTASSYPTKNFIALASITSGVITDSRNFINFKGYKRKGLNINKILYVDENGDEVELAYDTTIDEGKTIVVSSTGLSLQSPSVNIVGLIEKPNPIGDDFIVLSDSEDENGNKKTKLSSIIDFAKQDLFDKPILYTGSGGDGDLVVSSGTTSLNPNSIYEYENVTISGGTLTTNGLTDNGSLLVLLVKGTFTMTGGTINMNGLGGSPNKTEGLTSPVWYGRSYNDARGSANGRQAGFPVSSGTYKQLFGNITCGSGGSGADDGYGGAYIMRGGRGGGGIIIIANKINITGGTITANGLSGNMDSTYYGAGGTGGGAGGCVFLYSLNKANVDFDNVTITANGGNGLSGVNRGGYDNSYVGGGGGSNCNSGGSGSNVGPANVASSAGSNGSNGKGFGIATTGGIGGIGGAGVGPASGKTSAGSGGGGAGGDFYFYL